MQHYACITEPEGQGRIRHRGRDRHRRKRGHAQSLAGRVMPEDLARMVLFLAADDSRMCSAQEFIVDAGWA
ncbi:MAG: SDR family oxidoreductase [Rhodocyclaceae bacterium]|nr:SDR family oxidoreductase [Rhodocyclaceae bacterium]